MGAASQGSFASWIQWIHAQPGLRAIILAMMRRSALFPYRMLFLLLGCGLAMAQCSRPPSEAERKRHRDAQVDEFIHPLTIEEVWTGVRQVLERHGYEMPQLPPGGDFAASTDWYQDPQGSGRARYHGQLLHTGLGHCKLTMTREHEGPTDAGQVRTTNVRAYDIEWEVIQHLESELAAQIETEALRRAQAANQRGCSRGSSSPSSAR